LLKAVQPQSDMSIGALLFRIEQLERRLAGAEVRGGDEAPADSAPRAREAAAASAVSAPAAPVTTQSAPATMSAPATATAVATEPDEEPEPVAAPSPDLDLERLRVLWPTIVDEVCKGNQMVGAFLKEARPATLERDRLVVSFAPGAGFSKKKVESNRQLVQNAVRTLTGAGLDIRYELSDLAADEEGPSLLSHDELAERLKQDFGAKEVFED
jgi:hypothetical protein